MNKIISFIHILKQMGLRYVVFRIWYELQKRSGYFKIKFPSIDQHHSWITLNKWKNTKQTFFFQSREDVKGVIDNNSIPKDTMTKLKGGEFPYFIDQSFNLPLDDWHTNPLTNFKYYKNEHWSKISDFDRESGDIKYVWEKSRFCWLYQIIRNDQANGSDNSDFLIQQIISWIDENPINLGPNYICSQEISIRVLNWIFAIYYYSNSPALTESIFAEIQWAIYWQIDHVFKNIKFSRIAVRNNHALTETLALYLTGLLFPFFPGSRQWKLKGKKWFEEEVNYQIYDDGSYIQYSMNYHRVVIQLLTWAIRLSELNNDRFDPIVYNKAKLSIDFLEACQDPVSGKLPHYGANDGALFFPLNSANFRNYRPQLNALKAAIDIPVEKGTELCNFDDLNWYGLKPKYIETQHHYSSNSFKIGGYYTSKDKNSLTFIRSGSHRDRPSQADNLHLDIWLNGNNIIRDAGTYLYNGLQTEVSYFNSTSAHNTVQLGDLDQMEKGPRFIWYNWTKAIGADFVDNEDYWEFRGIVSAYKSINRNLKHERTVRRIKNKYQWIVEDIVHNKPDDIEMKQLWHINPDFVDQVTLTCEDFENNTIDIKDVDGKYASNYGLIDSISTKFFKSFQNKLTTKIKINI